MASTYLTRAEADPQSSQTTGTYSVWVKRGSLGSYQTIFNHRLNGSYEFKFIFYNDDTMFITANHNGVRLLLQTNRKFTDTNGWYHICIAVDSTQGSSTDRAKLYINGVQETSFVSAGGNAAVYPSSSQGLNLDGGSGYTNYIGSRDGSSEIFDGCMSHFHFVDGSQLAPTIFGSTDSTTGEWKINTSPSVTYATNSFFVLKDGNSGTDQSGQSNNYSVGAGTLTKTEDNPSNVFNTFNLLDNYYESGEFTNGNTTYKTGAGSSVYARNTSTLGMTKGKFYWEVKPVAVNTSGDYYPVIGISSTQVTSATDWLCKTANDYGLQTSANLSTVQKMNNNAGTAWGSPFSLNDIVGVAVDLDNRKIYFSKNGTWMESGNPASGSTGTGSAFTITAPADTPLGAYFPSVSNYDGTGWVRFETNFGNGYFGTTAVSSAGTNASGIGIFEYDVPTGYTALSTKGLNL